MRNDSPAINHRAQYIASACQFPTILYEECLSACTEQVNTPLECSSEIEPCSCNTDSDPVSQTARGKRGVERVEGRVWKDLKYCWV